jgi:(2Fe-2S) ferredoxin
MDHIRSMRDLEQARAAALDLESNNTQHYPLEIRVGRGSCGIAAGANETWEAINQLIQDKELKGVQTKSIGCSGMCALEPIVQVVEAGRPMVTYGRVLPSVVQRIFKEHIENHIPVQEYLIETI